MKAGASTPPSAAGRIQLLGLAAALVLLAFVIWHSIFLIDDAFISFRYALNWAEGHGPVYNVGATAPVEGYSNLSWVVLLALAKLAGAAPEVAAHMLSIAAAVGTLGLCFLTLTRRFTLDAWSTALGLVALAGLPAFSVWSTGGLETSLFGFLLLASWYVLTGARQERELVPGILAGLLGAGLVLTRVEGFLWIGGLFLAALIARRDALPWRRLTLFAGISVAALVAVSLWRHAVYGEWVANTVHAKAGFSGATLLRGARYLATYALCFAWPVVALVSPFLEREVERRRMALSVLLLVLGALVYNLGVGGDWMPFFRFLAPISAFLAVLLALGLSRLAQTPRIIAGSAAIVVALLPLFDLSIVPRSLRESLYFREFRIGYQTEWQRWDTGVFNTFARTAMGHAVAQITEEGESWTGGAIGAVGYYSKLTVLGRNGLVNREVAHREVVAGSSTAGHEKRVPRVWFRDQAPTYYDFVVMVTPVPPSGPQFDGAIKYVVERIFVEPGEEQLLECSVVEAVPLHDIEGLPEGSTMMVVRHVRDRRRAAAFWRRYRR